MKVLQLTASFKIKIAIMIRNYFKTAWRNIQRNKVNSFINVAGLSIGMACVILILLYVKDELNYDKFFKNAGHIFQVNMTTMDNGVESTTGGNTAPAVGPTMVSTYPEVEACARIYRPSDVMVRYEEGEKTVTYFSEKQVMAVDSNFLQVFNYPVLQGDAATCLQKPNSVVLTEQTAKKYFGSTNAIGKVLLFDTDKKPFIVTGVLKNIPGQSSFQLDMLVPIVAYAEVKKRSWNWFLQTAKPHHSPLARTTLPTTRHTHPSRTWMHPLSLPVTASLRRSTTGTTTRAWT